MEKQPTPPRASKVIGPNEEEIRLANAKQLGPRGMSKVLHFLATSQVLRIAIAIALSGIGVLATYRGLFAGR